MTTENQSAIVQLFRDVREYFAVKSPAVSVVFGRKERWFQINEGTNGANRVVFVPGTIDGKDGPLEGVDGPGETIIAPVKDGGGNVITPGYVIPRALHLQQKIVTVSIWAADTNNDPGARSLEDQQEEAIEQMFEFVQRAVKRSLAGRANAVWGDCTYNNEPNELKFGVEYLAEMTVGTQHLDDVPNIIFPTGATVSRSDS